MDAPVAPVLFALCCMYKMFLSAVASLVLCPTHTQTSLATASLLLAGFYCSILSAIKRVMLTGRMMGIVPIAKRQCYKTHSILYSALITNIELCAEIKLVY